ncbi:MAG: MmgE/PrpD family protein [Candidatus Solibacter sp.]
MSRINRRRFLGTTAMAATAVAAPTPQEKADPAAAKDVTRLLARFVVGSRKEAIPEAVRKEATRTLLNWVACAVGGSRHEGVDAAIRALAPFSGPAQATILGRHERMDAVSAALMNGLSSHVFDFDDTHLRTVIHPAGPVLPAILAWSEYKGATGSELLHALVLGAEVECRIGNAVYPAHYDVGWHITGTVGPFGAAAAAGKLMGLSEQQMVWALGIAATQPVGLREMFGSMTKSFHPGRAAQNGFTAALLAAQNFTSSNAALEAARGWANVLSTTRNYHAITDNLGAHYEISENTYKPFPCGVVIHPAIDGCLQMREQYALKAEEIARIELRVHPLVLELTGKKTPQTGLEGKFSVYHAVAAAIVEGKVGEQQFSDRAVRNPATVALRERVSAVLDKAIAEDQVRITIIMKDQRRLEKFIEHCAGSTRNPMTNAQLEAKFHGLTDGILPADRSRRLMDLCWKIESLPEAAQVARAAAV